MQPALLPREQRWGIPLILLAGALFGLGLTTFVAPPRNVCRSLLALGRDLWIYLPDAGKPVRIPFSQRLVGQVSNGDVARADYAGDYDATLAGEATVDGVACHVVDLKAKTKDVTYAAVKYWVFAGGDGLLGTATVSGI